MWRCLFGEHLNKPGNQVVDNGLSVVACDAETGKVCGCFTAIESQSFYNPSFREFWSGFSAGWDAWKVVGDDLEHMGDIMEKINVELKQEVNDIAKTNKLKSKNGILLEMIAVAVHQDYGKRGIAKELTNLLL